MPAALLSRAIEHGLCEIAANHRDPIRSAVAQGLHPHALHRERQIPRAAAQIQNASIRAAKNSLELAGRPAPPNAIDRQRKQMVQEIVPRRNPAEHFFDMRGSFAFATSAFGTRTPALAAEKSEWSLSACDC
jgi:hypothetical protein